MFYFLTVICTISILDRYDIAKFEWRQLQKLLTFKSGGFAIIIYSFTLIITLVTTKMDDKLSLYQHNSTLFNNMDDAVCTYIFWIQIFPRQIDTTIFEKTHCDSYFFTGSETWDDHMEDFESLSIHCGNFWMVDCIVKAKYWFTVQKFGKTFKLQYSSFRCIQICLK